MRHNLDFYQIITNHADCIEQELRALGAWQTDPLPAAAYQSRQAFFADTMTFYQWLQFVLLPRVREIIGSGGEFPSESSVATYAIRELDGNDDAGALILALSEFDEAIENAAR